MDKQTIYFRADGGPQTGMGHFFRSLALAEMLRSHFNCIFVTRDPTAAQIREINRICQGLVCLQAGEDHFSEFLAILRGGEIVVLDNYFFSSAFQEAVRKKGCRLVCIDDIHDRHFYADVLINHTGGIDPASYSVEPYTRLYLGYDYALLRKSFLEPEPVPGEKKFECVLMMGGADPFNTLPRILEALAAAQPAKPVAVISNRTPPNPAKLPVRLFKNLSANQTAALMLNAGYGLFPASTVALEACALRLPAICGYFIDNQAETYQSLVSRGMALGIGNLTSVTSNEIAAAVNKIRRPEVVHAIKASQRQNIDNQAPRRLLSIFLEL